MLKTDQDLRGLIYIINAENSPFQLDNNVIEIFPS